MLLVVLHWIRQLVGTTHFLFIAYTLVSIEYWLQQLKFDCMKVTSYSYLLLIQGTVIYTDNTSI
jgi:hypothetical protein